MDQNARIYVAGHRGLVGSAIVRGLQAAGYRNLLTRTHADLDLTDAQAVHRFFQAEKPQYVVLAAAKVGGILANNTYPADFIRTNLEIQSSVIEASYRSGVDRLLFLGSSCIYPKEAPQPIQEESLLTGPLEPTNRPYALAKIAGIEMCWSYNRQYGTRYLAAMPCNLYGPNDNFDLQNSHVLPALIQKAHTAKESGAPAMEVWGSGLPRRELLHSDDLAAACLHLLTLPDEQYGSLLREDVAPLVNIGAGEDISIRELAELVCAVVGYAGAIRMDSSKPDGTMRKLMDSSRMRSLGWQPRVPLHDGIADVYKAFRSRT